MKRINSLREQIEEDDSYPRGHSVGGPGSESKVHRDYRHDSGQGDENHGGDQISTEHGNNERSGRHKVDQDLEWFSIR